MPNAPVPPERGEKPTFRGSPEPKLGVELELAVLDRHHGDLAPGSPRILQVCGEERLEGVDSELMQSMLEVRTGVCADVAEARRQIVSRLRAVRNVATSLGYDLAMTGTHPSLRPLSSSITDDPRFQKLRVRLAWMTYHRVAFGLHVHVGVRSGDEAIAVMNLVMPYLPHLLALSANSPFWQGIDTGLASCRAPLYGLVAHSGVPGVFSRWKDFAAYFEAMHGAGAYGSVKSIKWDIRPRGDLGTLEFRICDMPDTLDAAFGLAALARSLVVWAQRLIEAKPQLRHADRRKQWITTHNKWLAARYALEAPYIRTTTGKPRALLAETKALLERLTPIAESLGDRPALDVWRSLDKRESGAARQRRLYRETGAWEPLIRDMVSRLYRSLDAATPANASSPPPASPPAAPTVVVDARPATPGAREHV